MSPEIPANLWKLGCFFGSVRPHQALELLAVTSILRWRRSNPAWSLSASQNQENLTFGEGNEADFLNPTQFRPDHLMRAG